MIPSFLLAALVRVLLMLSSVDVVRTVFGHGLKGKDPFADGNELVLPRRLRKKLRHRKDLQDALRFCMRGQQLRCAGAIPSAGGALAGAAEVGHGADLRTSFVQLSLSPGLEQLQLPWLGATVDTARLLHVQTHRPAPDPPHGAAPRISRPPSASASGAEAAAENGLGALSFTLWYLDGEQPLQMKLVAHDDDSLRLWVLGLRAALPPRAIDPL